MPEVMNSDYIRTAKAKGLSQFLVVYKHALKNSLIPVLTVVGLQTGILIIAFIFVVINLLVDLLYSAIDPRIQYK
ncbi:ABC-type dipeptide/oligopeptide/nickel transport system permease component [Paenibacillus sp. PastF-1]|nr:ABC-type dipeptide/oligopeptide/nickel transport system permease component [Paenibacillus sp. PastF-2]MDF9848821.1 ABC-type dipeptide/oligopeptide/nickel transport system permease component [Paenibacillus sp. PastM-2]MDF9855391.1 ABC-type dipeptide/oligopeptide/nickel transport system permease component [Paenibacillus sp. PastF-1]MDH6480733.1 ABC-type dipeptide/oligopeptide/nickel transport system permease component [Paenibacillus sp. PastH-2]MDH6508086.1 ABC-type dipeptide/oligopeptide/nick